MPNHPQNSRPAQSLGDPKPAIRKGRSCFRRCFVVHRPTPSRIPLTESQPLHQGSCHDLSVSAKTWSTLEEGPQTPKLPTRYHPTEVHMSNYLSGGLRPVSGLTYSQIKAGREVNEDAFICESREIASGARISLLGVFDGHGNEQLSHWLSTHFADVFFRIFTIFQQSYGLPTCLDYIRKLFPSDESFRIRSKRLSALTCPDVVTLSLCATFAVCEEQAMSQANIDTAHGGSCATAIAVTNAGFFIAKVGDSSAALVSATKPPSTVVKTSDHRTVNRPDEVHRIIALGGSVYKGNAAGMAFSSLNVTRSIGDTLWRANDDWRRDQTRDKSNQPAIDESLTQFSRQKGCVGLTSEPEWYSCCCHGGSCGGEEVVHWGVSTNSPPEAGSGGMGKLFKVENLRFFLIVGSDGFWETSAMAQILKKIADDPKSSPGSLIDTAAAAIGSTPHDDSTLVIYELHIDSDSLVVAPATAQRRRTVGSASSSNEADLTYRRSTGGGGRPPMSARQRRSVSEFSDKGPGGGEHLDYLFS